MATTNSQARVVLTALSDRRLIGCSSLPITPFVTPTGLSGQPDALVARTRKSLTDGLGGALMEVETLLVLSGARYDQTQSTMYDVR